MKKGKLVILALLLFQIVTFGQIQLSKDFKTTVGTPYKVIDAPSKQYFSDYKGHTYAIKTKGEKVSLQMFDITSMKEMSCKFYEDFPPYNKEQDIVCIGDKYYYIFFSINKKEKTEEVYAREVNTTSGTFEKPKLLFSTKSEVANRNGGIGAYPIKYEVYTSSDNSKILIKYRLKPLIKDDEKNYDVLGFYVFNSGFEKLWGGEVKMPYTEKQMNNIAYGVTKEGNAFMLAFVDTKKQFELFKINKDLKLTNSKINIDANLAFQELVLQETADGNISCVGYYATGIEFKVSVSWTGSVAGTTSPNINGILNFVIDQNGNVVTQNKIEFPLELINQYESKRTKDKMEKKESEGKAGINDLRLLYVLFDADGSVTTVGEQQYIRNEYVMTQMQYVYYYADIIATKFDKNGKVIWMKKLPKTQTGLQGKGGMSIKCIKGLDATYVLYLDNIKNAKLNLSEVPEKHQDGKGGYLTAYKIDEATGKVEKHSIFDITDIKGTEAFQFSTSRIFEAKDKVFMLEVYIKGKQDAMIKMELTK